MPTNEPANPAATQERRIHDRFALRLLTIATAHLRGPDDVVPAPFISALLGYAASPEQLTDTPLLQLINPKERATAPTGQEERHDAEGSVAATEEQRQLARVLQVLQPYANTPGIAFWIILEAQPAGGNQYTLSWWISDNRSIVAMPPRSGSWAELLQPAKASAALARHTAPWRDGHASILSARPFLVARDAMLETNRPTVWNVAGDVAVYREADQRSGSYLDVQRQCTAETPDAMLAELARARGDALADVYAAITARYIAAGAPDQGIWINVDDILRDRGLSPITKPEDRYSHGYRSTERLAIGEHLAELQRWKISGRLPSWQGKRGTRQRLLLIDSDLLIVTDTVAQATTDGRKVPLAVRCALGEYARHFLANGTGRQTALLMQTALRYDPKSEQTQKRLAYHLAFRWRLAAHERDYDQPIPLASLFREAHVAIDGATQRSNPGRTIDGWRKAFDDLCRDGLLASYELRPGPDEAPRGKIEQWLAQRIQLSPPAHMLEHYQPIGTGNPRLQRRT